MAPSASNDIGFTWTNPVLRGCAPDPSVVRVGSIYFLATSTFEYLPGIRLYQSEDLVNWVPLGGAVTRSTQYRRDGKPGPISLFAPTLRYHRGMFFLACTNVATGQGNFLLHTKDPAGDWSDAIWLDREAFDPSLFFDVDGTCYYTRRTLNLETPETGLGPIVQAIIDPQTGEMGALKAITQGETGFCSNDIEGPHLFRHGDWYYLTAAEGGTWLGHMQTIARSKSPWGPFDPCPHNPILTHRHRVMHPIQSLGHCDFVDDETGNWWALSLGTRHEGRHHILGRETFLHPVIWQDGWPVLSQNGQTELQCFASKSPASRKTAPSIDRSSQEAEWSWVGPSSPKPQQTDGEISFLAGASYLSEDHDVAVGALFKNLTEEIDEMKLELPLPDDDLSVGVGFVADKRHFYILHTDRGNGTLHLTRRVGDLEATSDVECDPLTPLNVYLCVSEKGLCFVLIGPRDQEEVLGPFSKKHLSAETTEWFTSIKFALFAEAAEPKRVTFKRCT